MTSATDARGQAVSMVVGRLDRPVVHPAGGCGGGDGAGVDAVVVLMGRVG